MVAFDLLYLNGYDLRRLPLTARKAHLKKLISKTAIQFSESFDVDGPAMFEHACGIGRLGGDPLRPIYAYTGAESDVPQKFVLDLRGKSATPEAIQAYQNNLTDVGAVAP